MDETLWTQHQGLPVATALGTTSAHRDLIPVDDPATRQTIGWCEDNDADDVDRAVTGADEAFASWATDWSARREAMIRGAEAIARQEAVLAATLVSEVGKPLFEAAHDIHGAVHLLRTFADLAEESTEVVDLTGRAGTGSADEVLLHRVPVGPVAIVTPWNAPGYLTFNCVGPALAAGCTVIVKPAESAPLGVTAMLRLLAEHLPKGVLQIVQGTGPRAGAALTAHPRVRGVLFVGGVVAGRRVLAQAAATIKKVSLELGGNDPALVLDDARIDATMVREMIAGAFSVSGQVCFAIKRVYVHRSRHEELVGALRSAIDQLVMGPGAHDGVHIGPLTTEHGFQNARRLREAALAAGANVYEGGVDGSEGALEQGRFVRPAIVTELPGDHELVLAEQFAPLLPVIPFDTDDEAIAEANRTEFGLASSVWSADPDHARDVAMRVEAGNTFINAHRVGASVPLVPFGGVKQSGLGRNHLMHAIGECMEEHAVVRYTDPARQINGIDPWPDVRAVDANAR